MAQFLRDAQAVEAECKSLLATGAAGSSVRVLVRVRVRTAWLCGIRRCSTQTSNNIHRSPLASQDLRAKQRAHLERIFFEDFAFAQACARPWPRQHEELRASGGGSVLQQVFGPLQPTSITPPPCCSAGERRRASGVGPSLQDDRGVPRPHHEALPGAARRLRRRARPGQGANAALAPAPHLLNPKRGAAVLFPLPRADLAEPVSQAAAGLRAFLSDSAAYYTDLVQRLQARSRHPVAPAARPFPQPGGGGCRWRARCTRRTAVAQSRLLCDALSPPVHSLQEAFGPAAGSSGAKGALRKGPAFAPAAQRGVAAAGAAGGSASASGGASCRVLVHKCLVRLGDVARYAELHLPVRQRLSRKHRRALLTPWTPADE